MFDKMFKMAALLSAGFGVGLAGTTQAQIGNYYVGLDNAATVGFGTYSGLANTNQDRLTLLFHHGNHYHGIGTYSYTGAVGSEVATDTNSNNRLPEDYTGLEPLSLLPGSGDFAGTYRSGLTSLMGQDLEYGDFTLRNVHSLDGVDDVIYNSSGGQWNSEFNEADIHLELVSATNGLKIAFGSTPVDGLPVGGDVHLGAGDEMFEVLPTFWVDGGAAVGSTYTAEFVLTDVSGNFGDSGRFYVDFQVVPEPASLSFLAIGGMIMLRRRCA